MTTLNPAIDAGRTSVAGTSDWAALLGRMGLALIFLLSGLTKLTAVEGTLGYISSVGLPFPAAALAIAVAVEVGGAIALVLGLRVRATAAVLALFSLATAFAFHADLGDQNQFIHFMKNIAMAGGLLQVMAFGGGRLTLGRK